MTFGIHVLCSAIDFKANPFNSAQVSEHTTLSPVWGFEEQYCIWMWSLSHKAYFQVIKGIHAQKLHKLLGIFLLAEEAIGWSAPESQKGLAAGSFKRDFSQRKEQGKGILRNSEQFLNNSSCCNLDTCLHPSWGRVEEWEYSIFLPKVSFDFLFLPFFFFFLTLLWEGGGQWTSVTLLTRTNNLAMHRKFISSSFASINRKCVTQRTCNHFNNVWGNAWLWGYKDD